MKSIISFICKPFVSIVLFVALTIGLVVSTLDFLMFIDNLLHKEAAISGLFSIGFLGALIIMFIILHEEGKMERELEKEIDSIGNNYHE